MNKYPTTLSGNEISTLPGLERFIDRLEPGMDLEGRIVDLLGQGIFILRIWGNNILTESSYPFQRFDEAILHVKAVKPRLVFSIRPAREPQGRGIYA